MAEAGLADAGLAGDFDPGRFFRGDALRLGLLAFVAVVLFGLWQVASGVRGSTETTAVPSEGFADAVADALDASELSGGWVRIDLPGRADLVRLAQLDGVLFAAGWNETEFQSEVWRSEDGMEWQRIADPDDLFVGASINDFVLFDGAVVAVGARLDGEVVRPLVLRSPDGEEFVAINAEQVGAWPGAHEGEGGMTSVVVAGGRLVAAGWSGPGDLVGGQGATQGAVWVSETGKIWDRAYDDPGPFAEEGTVIRALDVSDDGIVAVGEAGTSGGVWESEDAEEWRPVGDDEPIFGDDLTVEAVASRPEATLAIGSAGSLPGGPTELRLWATTGESWQPLIAPDLDGVTFSAVTTGAAGFLAAGVVGLPDDRAAAGLWASADGQEWERIRVDAVPANASAFADVAVHPRGVVTVGEAYGQPAVWFHATRDVDIEDNETSAAGIPIPPPAWAAVFQETEASNAVPDRFFRAGTFIYGVAEGRYVWTSTDGQAWAPSSFEGVGLGAADRIDAIVASSGGEAGSVIVALGVEDERTGLWVSRDGQTWGRPSKAPPCCVRAIFPSGNGFYVLGQDPADNNGWFTATSSDGAVWDIDLEIPVLPADGVWRSAHVNGRSVVWGGTSDGPDGNVWFSLEGRQWYPVLGPENAFTGVVWQEVWVLADTLVGAVTRSSGAALFMSQNGLEWIEVPLPSPNLRATAIHNVSRLDAALAIGMSVEAGPIEVWHIGDDEAAYELPLTGRAGFGGLTAAVIPTGDAVRVVGPDHGRMTVWEWIPPAGPSE